MGSCCVQVADVIGSCWKAGVAAGSNCMGSCCVQAARMGGSGSWQGKVLLAYKATRLAAWLQMDSASLCSLCV